MYYYLVKVNRVFQFVVFRNILVSWLTQVSAASSSNNRKFEIYRALDETLL